MTEGRRHQWYRDKTCRNQCYIMSCARTTTTSRSSQLSRKPKQMLDALHRRLERQRVLASTVLRIACCAMDLLSTFSRRRSGALTTLSDPSPMQAAALREKPKRTTASGRGVKTTSDN